MIKVENLGRNYGDFKAVSSLNFEIPRGQIVGLLGHNGAGKTTTLKMLTGFLEPTTGFVKINGIDVSEDPKKIQENLGYLPEMAPIYPDMTILDYLEYVAKMRNIPENLRPGAIREAVEATDLHTKIMDPIRTLSKGYKQRVGVAQAILHKPELLVLDEPTSGLDPSQIIAMRSLIKRLAMKATVIISTHIMQEVEAICDRVIIVLQGRLALDSTLENLKKNNSIHLKVNQGFAQMKEFCSHFSEITNLEELSSDHGLHVYQIEVPQNIIQHFAPKLASEICSRKWNLYNMSVEHRTLETVFRDVNKQVVGDSLYV